MRASVLKALFATLCCAAIVGCGGDGGGDSTPTAPQLATAPTITAQPTDVTVDAGATATLTVTANGTPPLAYQWQANGADIAGATDVSYVQASVTMAQAGTKYSVKVSNGGGSATSSVATLKVRQAITVDTSTAYLAVDQLGVDGLAPEIAAQPDLAAKQASGPSMSVKLGADRVLRFLSPSEQHDDSTSIVELASADGNRSWQLAFAWTSRLGAALNRISEADESGPATDDSTTFTPTGADDSGLVDASMSGLSYVLANATGPLAPADCFVSLATANGSTDVTAMFAIDPVAGTIALKPESVATLKDAVRNAGSATLTFSLSTAHYAKTYGYEHVLTWAGGSLAVSVVDAGGSAATDLAGTQFVASGFNTGVRVLATADANGQLTFGKLPADSYFVQQVLLDVGNPLVGFGTLATSETTATLTLTRSASGKAAANQVGARLVVTSHGPKARPAAEIAARTRLDARERALAAKPAAATASGVVYTTSATASQQDTLIVSAVNYAVPKGTTHLGLHVEVFTEEFPVYTGQQSIYNDVWQFNVLVPGAPAFAKSGKVNQSHATQGTIAYDLCLDVSTSAKDADLPLTGQLGAENVADSALATSVTLAVSLDCGGSLNVTAFDGKATGPSGQLQLYPRKFAASEMTPDGNVAGQYLSLPMSANLPAAFGIPATLTFEPANATIDSVELFVRTASEDTSVGKAYLSQASAKPGVLTFSGLLLDPTALTPTSNRIELVAVLHGSVSGTAADSQPFPLTVAKLYTNFTALYLASELPSYNAANRFPAQDEPGGDSWGTWANDSWIMGTGLHYNDISAAQVAQTATKRSILGHAGHSDGQQVDVRYWDGSGGFTGVLGGAGNGAGISDLADAAQAEADAKATAHPSLDKLVAWITQNRANIGAYATQAPTRRIYIGNDFVSSLLVDGEFPGSGGTIPGITAWTDRSSKVLPQDKHLNHWHISSYRP